MSWACGADLEKFAVRRPKRPTASNRGGVAGLLDSCLKPLWNRHRRRPILDWIRAGFQPLAGRCGAPAGSTTIPPQLIPSSVRAPAVALGAHGLSRAAAWAR